MASKLISRADFEAVVEAIANGFTLRQTLKERDIHPMSFAEYLSQIPDADELYERARLIRTEMYAEETIEIADNEPDPNRARVMIDARKWLASKLNPKRYGDKIDINISQKVDIGGALKEARQRAITANPESLVIDATYKDESAGSKPVSLPSHLQNDIDDDILS